MSTKEEIRLEIHFYHPMFCADPSLDVVGVHCLNQETRERQHEDFIQSEKNWFPFLQWHYAYRKGQLLGSLMDSDFEDRMDFEKVVPVMSARRFIFNDFGQMVYTTFDGLTSDPDYHWPYNRLRIALVLHAYRFKLLLRRFI